MRALPRLIVSALLGSTVLLGATAASAQPSQNAIPTNNGDGFDTHLFRPALDSKGFFHTNGTDILGHLDPSFGLVIDYGRNLLRVPARGQGDAFLIEHSFQGTFSFNLGLFNVLAVGLTMPVNLMSGSAQVDGQTPAQPTQVGPIASGGNGQQWFTNQFDSQVVSYIAPHAKVRLLRVEKGFGLAASVQVGIPVSQAARNAGGEPSPWVWPQIIGEKRFGSIGQFKIGLNAGIRVHGPSDTIVDLRNGQFRDGNRLTYGAGLAYRILEPVDIVADTYATFLLSNADSAVKPSNEVVGGLKIFVERNSYLFIGAGPRYTSGFEAADFRGIIGFSPEGSEGDRDGDGILDKFDKCPDEPEDKDGFQDQDGCPDPDNDQDGIPDKKDLCPNDPEDKDGFEDQDGCPDPDNDKDGILDVVDKCPNEPETYNGFEDEDGCPDKGNVIVDGKDIVILKKIKFKTASAEILPESNEILDAVATTIIHHPEFTLIEIAGHADERASDEYNLKLTQDRVNSVMNALIQRRVSKDHLRSKGYGEFCPEDNGHNEEAWEKNRRVEFKIVKTKDGPTGVELGCANATSKGVKPEPVP